MELSKEAIEARRAYMRQYRRNMSQEAREKERQYIRDWRRRNPDKVRQNNIDYWERKAGKDVTVTDTGKLTVTNVTTVCQECGHSFKPKRSDARFCSTVCRVRFNRKHSETWKRLFT